MYMVRGCIDVPWPILFAPILYVVLELCVMSYYQYLFIQNDLFIGSFGVIDVFFDGLKYHFV